MTHPTADSRPPTPEALHLHWLDLAYAALLVSLTCALHLSLLRQFTTAIPGDLGDPLLNTWILWWNAHAVPFSSTYWNAPIFAPAPSAFALSETLLGLTWITTPLQWLGASPLVAYNVVFVLTPVLNGLAAYWLCLALTKRRDAAAIGGLAFAWAPYHAHQLAHVQMQAAFGMPLALLGLHRYWETGRRRWLVCFGGAFTLSALVCGYFLLYFSVFLAIAIAWLAIAAKDLSKLRDVAVALVLSLVALAPVIWEFRSVRSEWHLDRSITEIESLSADVVSFFQGSQQLAFWPVQNTDLEGAEYSGVVIALLLVVGAVEAFRQRRPVAPASRWRRLTIRVLMAIATLALMAGLVTSINGPWDVRLGPISISVSRAYKPIGIAIDLFLVAAMLSPRFTALIRSGSLAGLYSTGAVVAAICALGPVGRIYSHRFWYKAPFAWLMTMPGFDSVRVPARFGIIVALCLTVLVALIVARLVPRSAKRSFAFTIVLALAIVLDGWSVVPVATVPRLLPMTVNADLVVELPTRGWMEDAPAMYRATAHERRIVNGYSGYLPPHYLLLQNDLKLYCLDSLDALRRGRSLDVIIWRDQPEASHLDAAFTAKWAGASRLETPQLIRYRLPRAASSTSADATDSPIDLKNQCLAARTLARPSSSVR